MRNDGSSSFLNDSFHFSIPLLCYGSVHFHACFAGKAGISAQIFCLIFEEKLLSDTGRVMTISVLQTMTMALVDTTAIR